MTSRARYNRENPLHRRGDRIERTVINLAVLVFAAIVPLAIYLASNVHSAVTADEHRQAETKSRVDATLTSDAHAAPIPGDATGRKFIAEARWTVNTGQTFHGVVDAEYENKRGDTIPVWIDSSGKATTAPETPADAEVTAGLTGLGVIVVSGLALGCGVLLFRSRLAQSRMNHWELEWQLIEPIWSGRSKSA